MCFFFFKRKDISFYKVTIGQECARKRVCFGECRQEGNYFPWKRMPRSCFLQRLPFAVKYPRTLISLQLKKSEHSIRRENLAAKIWRKIYYRGKFQRTNTKAHNLENLLTSSRDSFLLEHGSYSERSGMCSILLIPEPCKYLSTFILTILDGEISISITGPA